jgi:phosphoribosylformylglycinamidine cyclo-ligase
MDYKKAGVDIDAGDRFVDIIAPAAKATYRKEVMGGIGPFAALFELDLKKYKRPVLVSSTDGVGTKLKLAIELKRYDTIGQDLVAMCVNDLICCGAEPLFFLDYFAMGRLLPEEHAPVIKGIARACKECGCSLIGGETAEMPGMYMKDDFDLAGFAVGVVEKDKIINGTMTEAGDVIIGIASSGVHSNGYSLVRRVIEDAKVELASVADMFLAPTKLYPSLVRGLLQKHGGGIKGIAHITGGGLEGNIPRVLPETFAAELDAGSWERPEVFGFLQRHGNIQEDEMRRVFNLGIGLAIVVSKGSAEHVMRDIKDTGEKAWVIGKIIKRKRENE